ncbi:MAG: hypothetical protein PHW82_10210 [Bacteroidales bacterium]|nr:hypothetical protein [Bacteroidales bacterium]
MKKAFVLIIFSLFILQVFCSEKTLPHSSIDNTPDSTKYKQTAILIENRLLNQNVIFNYSSYYLNELNSTSDNLFLNNYNAYSLNSGLLQRGLDPYEFNVVYKGIVVNENNIQSKFIPSWSGLTNILHGATYKSELNYTSNLHGGSAGTYQITTEDSQNKMNGAASITTNLPNFGSQIQLNYSSGILSNGISYTIAASGVLAPKGYIEETGLNQLDYFAEISKSFGDKHIISLSLFGNNYYGIYSTICVNEVYELRNDKFYNPNYGYWNDEILNANYSRGNNYNGILNHNWKISEKNSLNTSVSYFVLNNAVSELEYYDAISPFPTYYRYLPGYYNQDSYMYSYLTNQWTNEPDFYRLNWDNIYYANTKNLYHIQGADGITGNDVFGNRAKYYISEHNQSVNNVQATSQFTNKTENSLTTGGIYIKHKQSQYYKSMASLLGADFQLDISKEAEYILTGLSPQSDLQITNNLIYEGDTFGYSYILTENNYSGFFLTKRQFDKTDISISGNFGYKQFLRTGNMKNFFYSDNSLGKGEKISGLDYRINGLIRYNISNKMKLSAGTSWFSGMPEYNNIYLFPNVSDSINNYHNYSVFNSELNYSFVSNKIKIQLSGFYNNTFNQTTTNNIYDEVNSSYLTLQIDSINLLNTGLELYAEYNFAKAFYLHFSASHGIYKYTNRPVMNVFEQYKNDILLEDATLFTKNYKLPNFPQTILNIGITFNNSRNWFARINANYYNNIYGGFAPECRTEFVADDFGVASIISDAYFTQQKLNGGISFNLTVGKSFNILNNQANLNIFASVKNILNNQNISIASKESSGIYANSRQSADKYAYLNGRVFFLKISFTF